MQVTVNDRQGNRDRQCAILASLPGGVIRFRGQQLPGVRVLAAPFTKDGKWSHTTYLLEVADDCEVVSVLQGWTSGRYVDALTWERGIAELQARFTRAVPTAAAVERFVRAEWPALAARLDAERQEAAAAPDPFAVQAEAAEKAALEAAIAAAEAEISAAAEAAAQAARNAAVRTALQGGKRLTLAELQALRAAL